MPEKLERCVQEVMRQGHTESEAYAICNSKLNKPKKKPKQGKKIIEDYEKT